MGEIKSETRNAAHRPGELTTGDHTDQRYIPPIIGATVYPNGTWEVRRAGFGRPDRHPGRGDGKIEYLSARSRARLLFMATETGVKFNSMMTLTYGRNYPQSGRRVKSDLNKFLNWIRRNLGCQYLWFLEFQSRGAPHLHILLELPVGDRYEFADRWARIAEPDWSERIKVFKVHSHPKQWENSKTQSGMVRYVAKYATKTSQKFVPANYQDVGRFWGVSSGVRLTIPDGIGMEVSEEQLRDYLAEIDHRVKDWEVIPKLIFGVTFDNR